jgi:hypothetical protein
VILLYEFRIWCIIIVINWYVYIFLSLKSPFRGVSIKSINQSQSIKTRIPFKTRIIVYNALILPLLDYGDIIWGDKNNSSLMDQLQVLQNKAAKTILDAPYLSSSTEALNKLHWHRSTYTPTRTTPNTNHI